MTQRDPQALLAQDLPPNLQRLILARIDQLSEAQKVTIKVASVIGRWFRYSWLRGYYPHLGSDESLKADLDRLACLDLTPLETPEPELSYLFKHILTRDVAYESLSSTTRASLHGQLAEFLEANLSENSEHFLDLLAYHYDLSDRADKRRAYLRRAGEAAVGRFANTEAVDYLGRALEAVPLSEAAERFNLLLERERVYDLLGDRAAQEQDVKALEALAEASHDPGQCAQAALRRSNYAWLTSDQPTAVSAAQKAVAWARQAELPRAEAAGHRRWGLALADPGDYAQALAHYTRALEILRSIGERKDEAITLGNMGVLAHSKGNYTEANTYLEQSLEIARQIGDRKQQAAALNSLGVLARVQGDYPAARACYEQSLEIARAIGDRRQQGSTLNNLGTVSLAQGDHLAADTYYEQALEIARAINNRRMQSNILNNLGLIDLERAEFSLAGKHFEQSLAIDRATKNRRGESVTLGNLGDVAQATGDYPTARACYEQTLSIARTLGNKEDEGWALGALGSVALALGFFESARVYYQQSLEIVRQTGDRLWEGSTLVGLGNATLGLGKTEEASGLYHQALDLWRDMKLAQYGVEAKAGLALAALAQEEAALALEYAAEIMHYLQAGIPEGVKDPLRLFLACYRVFQRSQDPRCRGSAGTGTRRDRAPLRQHRRAGCPPPLPGKSAGGVRAYRRLAKINSENEARRRFRAAGLRFRDGDPQA